MQVRNPIYTWESSKGNVSLFDQDGQGNYSLSLTTLDQLVHEIPRENIQGFETAPERVEELSQYFFRLKKKRDEQFYITFFRSAVRDDFDSDKSTFKALGDIGIKFNKLEQKVRVVFSDTAPDYRRVCEGLNFEGKCANPECESFKHDVAVIVNQGIGKFRVAEILDELECSACDRNIPLESIKNLGFWNCIFTIKGKQTKPEVKMVDTTDVAEKDHYTTFKSGDEAKWTYLKITTERIGEAGKESGGADKQGGGRGRCTIS